MSREENERRTWHFALPCDYDYDCCFRREKGKGYTKNRDKDKYNRSAPYAGRGKGGRSTSPYWTAGQTGGSSSSNHGIRRVFSGPQPPGNHR
eukprot:7199196-Pyramimonas_sp.AAC.1